MRSVILTVTLLLPMAAEAAPMNDAYKKEFIRGAMKECLTNEANDPRYCWCFSVTMADKTTGEDAFKHYQERKFPDDYFTRVIQPAAKSCSKSWWQVWK